jgi:response regulator RpfG family c-di-GMP phosphodiesterase
MKTIQILVVEDERIVADDIKMILQRLGYVVSGMASSGEEAVKKAEEIHPDLVLMDIVLEARILAVADVVEAMSSHRPYRPALGQDKAMEEISQNKGILYDPKVVDACLKVLSKNRVKLV